MKQASFALVLSLGLFFTITGCAKKEEPDLTDATTGFDTATTEELAQLPQSAAPSQAGIEVLPIEPMPQTPAFPASDFGADTGTLSQPQKIQTALRNAGFYGGNIDGKIGPASKRAIEQFQQSHNLKVDGKVGPKTWAALEPYLSGAPAAESTQIE